jgi:hypothetical protein
MGVSPMFAFARAGAWARRPCHLGIGETPLNAWLDNARRLLGRMFEPSPPDDLITLLGDRFEVRNGDASRFEVTWNRVERIVAFKLDCFGVDLICLGFVLTNLPDRMYVIDEEAVGYDALVEEMQRRCPGFAHDWWLKVAQPPFARSETLVWRRPESDA